MRLAVIRFLALCAVVAALAAPARAEVDVQELTSPEGLPFWLVQEMSIPIVSLELGFPTGSWTDPEGKEGVSRFAMGLMDEGSGELDAVAFSEARSDIAARFGFGAGRDGTSVSARFLVETLDESVDLMALAMTSPRFDADAVARVRQQILSSIAQAKTSPGSIAGLAWFERAYPGHPYGRPSTGTEESITSITVEDLRAAHRRLLTRGDVDVAIVGAVTPEEAGAIVDRLLSPLPQGAAGDVPQAATAPPAGLHVIELPVPQSFALFGHAGIDRDDPDFITASVMNHIFGGGGFTSRLTNEVREKRGLAYSVTTSLSVMDGAQMMLGSVQTANARIAESIEVIREQWARMAAGEVSAEEVEAAKTYITGSFPLSFDTNSKIANYLVWIMGQDYDSDYINRRNSLIEAVTVEDVRRVAARLMDAEALSIVVVGQPEGL